MVDTIFFTFVFAWYSVLRNLLERVLIILLLKLLSCATSWTIYSPWNFPGQNIGVGSLSLLQGIFPTQGWNPGFLHCRRILYHLSHKVSPRILEWVTFSFSRGSSQPRDWTQITRMAGGFFTSWATREAWFLSAFRFSVKHFSSERSSLITLSTVGFPIL